MNYDVIYSQILDIPDVEIVQASKNANGSKRYACKSRSRKTVLKEIFEVSPEDSEVFDRAYAQATQGKGKELKRITTLHSSSLLGLLTFFKVSENSPIWIKGIKYNKACFEVESRVFDSNSSIDVMLVSADEKTLLFLELKFTEFLSPTRRLWLSDKYFELYSSLTDVLTKSEIVMGEVEQRIHKRREDGTTYISNDFMLSHADKRNLYFSGIKQMISHLFGLTQSPASGSQAIFESYVKGKHPRIILATILYDTTGIYELSNLFKDYKSLYCSIFSKENDIPGKIKTFIGANNSYKVEILNAPLTYQNDVKDENGQLPYLSSVKSIYRF